MVKVLRAALWILVPGLVAFIGCDVEEVKPIPPNPATLSETGQKNRCDEDADCWCRNFDGKFFLEGKRASNCCLDGMASDCGAKGYCLDCLYDSLVPSDKPRVVIPAPVSRDGLGDIKILDGEDGYPLIMYETITRGGAYGQGLVKCGDAYCHYGNAALGYGTGRGFDFALGADGFPIIVSAVFTGFQPSASGGHENAFRIKVARCKDPACSVNPDTIRVDTAMDAGLPEVVVGTDGLPTLAYYNPGRKALRLISCGSPDCSTGNSSLDLAKPVGTVRALDLLSGRDGNPMVVYSDQESVKLIRCRDRTCSPPNPATEVVRGAAEFSAALAPSGLAVLAYVDSNTLKVGFCGNASCSEFRRSNSLDSGRQITSPQMVIRKDGLPVVLYGKYAGSAGSMAGTLLARCQEADCKQASSTQLLDHALLDLQGFAVGKEETLLFSWPQTGLMFRRFSR